MKAQTKVSFLITSFIFMVFIAFFSLYFSDALTSIVYEAKLQNAELKAELIADILVREKGLPQNWESNPFSAPLRLGLSNGTSHILDSGKLSVLNSHCELFEKSFGILNYRVLVIDEDGAIRLECGGKGGAKAYVEKTVVLDDGKKAILSLEIWW